jgi:hypothetical protein
MVKKPRAALAVALTLAALAAGCGGGGDDSTTASADLPPGHESVQVIDEWVKTLSSGDVSGAADLFALPSVVENGTPPIRLSTHADAVTFNRSLPCGAELVRARPDGRFIAATFRLTERPGGDCGSGVGGLAQTAFLIRGGKIVEWHRLPDTGGQAPSGPIV